MNSVILTSLKKLFVSSKQYFETSKLNKIIDSICDKFSCWWKSSVIMTTLSKESMNEKGFFGKMMYAPVYCLEFLNKKIGSWISDRVENSFILDLARTFMNNILAINTRFLGCVAVSMISVKAIMSQVFSPTMAAISVFGVIMLIFNYNISDFFDGSKLIGFLKKVTGLSGEISNIYKKEYVGGIKPLVLAVLVGSILGVVSFPLALAAIIGFTGLCVVLSYPIVGVFGAVFAAPFVPTMVLAGICVLTTGSLCVQSIIRKDFVWKKEGIGIGYLLALLFVSCLFSFSPIKSMMVWGMYLIFAGFYFVIINTVKTKEQVYGLLRVFVIAGGIVALYGILQYVFGWNTSNAWIDEQMFEEATMRAYSTMENPNVLGEFLLFLVPLAAIFFLGKGTSVLEKILYCGIFLAGVLCMIFTQSRGCWLGLIFAAAIFVTFYKRKLWALFPLVLLAIPFVLPEAMLDRFMSVGDLGDSSTSYRVFIWKGTFRMLRDFWIGGIGMGEGSFRSVYPLYAYVGIIAPHSHNTFLQLVVEGGIGALAIFIGIMITFLRKVSRVFKTTLKDSVSNLSALAIGAGVYGFLVQSLFDYTFYNYRMMAMFFMILALGISLKINEGEKE